MVRVLAVADSDSYLKWSAAVLAGLPPGWSAEQVVLTSPITPSLAQIHAATSRPVWVLGYVHLAWKILRDKPDVLLLGCTGPVIRAILAIPYLRHGRRRPVLVTGLPGISVPVKPRGIAHRSECDLLIVHSHREREEFDAYGQALAPGMLLGLARLPFLSRGNLVRADTEPACERPVVFAAQAQVPPDREARRGLLLELAEAAGSQPIVVKLRASAGQQQTHRELWPYPDLWAELVAEGKVAEAALRFSTGAMSAALDTAAGLVTVSSTAALEAIAADIPVVILSDFGVSAEMINLVFEQSGCLGTLDDVRQRRFFSPDPEWLRSNYFHPAEDSDWLKLMQRLLAQRHATGLSDRPIRGTGLPAERVRQQLRLALPPRAWAALASLRRSWRGVRTTSRASRGQGRRALARLRARRLEPAPAEPPHAPVDVHH